MTRADGRRPDHLRPTSFDVDFVENPAGHALIRRNVSPSPGVRNRYVPSRSAACSMPFRASVSATSRAVSSAERTSVTSRPKTRWRIGRISG